MFKKLILAAAALAVSAPALAGPHDKHAASRHFDRGYSQGHGHAYGHRHVVVHKPVHVVHRPVYYRPAPVVHHYYHRPAPRQVVVVERHSHVNPAAVLVGAVIGAAIVHHAVTGY